MHDDILNPRNYRGMVEVVATAISDYFMCGGPHPSQREAEFIAVAPELVAQLTRALKSVDDLASKWENATNLTDGQPNIVARAFADDLRRALAVAS